MRKNKPQIKLINTHQAKSDLSKLIKAVEEDNIIVKICRNGTPIVELVKVRSPRNPLAINKRISKIKFFESPVAGAEESDWPEESR